MTKNRILLTVLIIAFTMQGLMAFQFTPITRDFTVSGGGTRQTFRVSNSTDRRIAVQVGVFSREMDVSGKEALSDASNLFFVYPRQVVVSPGDYQTVRVQWRGPARTSVELPFRIVAEQLPLEFQPDSGGASLNILLTYRGTMYVMPESPRMELELLSVGSLDDEDGVEMLAFEFENKGNVHQLFNQPTCTVTSRSQTGAVISEVVLDSKDLQGLQGENILAGNRRVFLVPWPEGLKRGELEAAFQLSNTR